MKESVNDITLLYELIWKFLHALERSIVQFQLLGVFIICSLAFLITQGLLILCQKRFPSMKDIDLTDHKPSLKYYITALLRYTCTPTLSLVGVYFLQIGFVQ